MATFTLTHQPNEVELAYGPVIVTTYNSDTDGVQHAMKVFDSAGNQLAFYRQPPNPVGYTHFDISKILQRQLQPDPLLEGITALDTSEDEVFEYEFTYGHIDPTSNTYISASDPIADKRVLYGRKTFSEVDWSKTPYVPTLFENTEVTPPENEIISRGRFLSDRTYYTQDASTLPGTVPTKVTGTVYRMSRRSDDDLTFSWMNDWEGSTVTGFSGLAGFAIDTYDADDNLITTTTTTNIINNGGGPNTAPTDNIQPSGSYSVISIAAGNNNTDVNLSTGLSYYYITPYIFKYDPGLQSGKAFAYDPVRVDIDDSNCATGFTPIEFSWVNSYGFKDYFTFEKRNEKQTKVQRSTYNKTFPDWSQATYAPTAQNRGESVYGVEVDDSYTATTRYITEDEMIYLRNLIVSPEVKIKFEDTNEWVPVIITTDTWTQRSFVKDGLFQLEIRFKLANPNTFQAG